jgi:hypothetical protein
MAEFVPKEELHFFNITKTCDSYDNPAADMNEL